MSEEPAAAAAPDAAPADATPAAATPGDTGKPQTQRFRKRYDSVRLTPEAAARQGRAATLAWEVFRDRDAMVAFLNTQDDALGGRPIDLAVESAAGLETVEKALRARGSGTEG